MACPADDLLAAVAEGRASPRERALVEAHLDTCSLCSALVADAVRAAAVERVLDPPDPGTDALGRYEVSIEIGRGGMGRVYRAYDPELRRDVALKLIASNAEILASEARALARLRHPNVVEVFDVGRTRHGLFIAMELVRGVTLQRWCAAQRRGWREIVKVFADAGRGLAAAHAIGIVHRDFKPANVMIGRDGRVRVMDFGLARTQDDAADAHQRAVMGTPRYMAPEQRAGGLVDARSDQYAFCVAVYEALCGEAPRAARSFPARVDAPARLRALVLRGLQSDPEQRWGSMDALVRQLDRIAARPGRLTWVAAPIAIVVLAAFAGLEDAGAQPCLATGLAGIWGVEQRDQLLQDARLPASSRQAIGDALDGWAEAWHRSRVDACSSTTGRELRIDCLVRARTELETVIDGASEGVDEVDKIAEAVFGLPDVDACADLDAVALAAPPPSDPEIAASVSEVRRELARIDALERLGRYDEAWRELGAIEPLARATRHAPLLVEVDYARGWLQERRGDYEEAAATLARVYLEAHAAGHDEIAAQALLRHAFVLVDRVGRGDDAMSIVGTADAAVERAGGRAELRATYQRVLGATRRALGDYDGAARAFERERTILEASVGKNHGVYAVALSNVGAMYTRLGRYQEARAALERSLDTFTRLYGPDHAFTAFPLNQLGLLEGEVGDFDAAMQHIERAVAINEEHHGAGHPVVIAMRSNLAAMAYRAGDRASARRQLERVIAAQEAGGTRQVDIAKVRGNLALIAQEEGRLDEARDAWERALVVLESDLGPEHPELRPTLTNLGELYVRLDRPHEGAPLLERALALEVAAKGDDHPDLAHGLLRLARAARARSEAARAEDYALRALALATDVELREEARAIASAR